MVIQFTYQKQWIEASFEGDSIKITDIESKNTINVLIDSNPFRDGSDKGECLRSFAIGVWLTHPHLSSYRP